jgi:aconitate hydratase
VNVLTGEEDAVPATARYYKSKGLPWVVVGECRGADGILEGGGP